MDKVLSDQSKNQFVAEGKTSQLIYLIAGENKKRGNTYY